MLPIYVTFELLMVKGKQIDLGQANGVIFGI